MAEFAIQIEKGLPVDSPEPISCRKGCSACCRQAVPLSPAEALHVAETLRTSASRRSVLRRMADIRRVWRKGDADTSPFHARYFSMGKFCPFLVDGACSIHARRPLACREHNVSSDPRFCATFGHPFVRMVSPAISVRDALAKVSSALLGLAPVSIPLTFVPEWLRTNPESGRRLFSEKEMALALLRELGAEIHETGSMARKSL